MPERPGPRIASLAALKAATMACRECPIGEIATQSVIGEGRLHARLMLVGEQPGDQEDLQARPFADRPGGCWPGRCSRWASRGPRCSSRTP